MKVAFLVGGYPSDADPARGVFNERTALALSKRIEVIVIHLQGWRPGRSFFKKEQRSGITVYRIATPKLPAKSGAIVKLNERIAQRFSWQLLKHVLRDVDVIHSVFLTFGGMVGSFWKKKLGAVKHLSQAIGSDVNSQLPAYLKRDKDNPWWCQIDGVLCNSCALKEALERLIPGIPNAVVAYRGIASDRFDDDLGDKGSTADNSFNVLYLGGFGAYPELQYGINTKGGITLMKSWELIDQQSRNLQLTIGGPASQSDMVKEWINGLQQPSKVKLAGYVSPNQIPTLLSQSDLVVIPSMEEGLPNLLLEASLMAKPVVGTKVGGIPEVIIDQKTGFLIEPDAVQSLSQTILQACELDNLEQLGVDARQRVLEHFNAANYAPNIIQLYEKLLQA
ncbi:MAG: glycosyltransferase family 4 protein [Bacteroidota bacterium]